MAGILDIFDNPAVLSRLFGGGEGMAGGGTGGVGATPWSAPTPPQPPPQQQAQAQPEPQEAPRTDPAQTLDFGNMRGGGIGSDAARVPNQPGNMPQTAGGIGSDAARTPDIPQPEWTPPVPPQQVRIPPGAAPTAAPIPPQVRVPPPAVPMPPAGDFVNAPAGQGTGGGLMGALGIDRRNLRSALQGIGKGFTAASKPGLSVGQALAAGAGASMEGGSAAEERQDNTAFQQGMQGKNYELARLNSAIRTRMAEEQVSFTRARTEVLNLKKSQDVSSKAWQMSEPGKFHIAQTEIQQYEKGQIALYREELKQATLADDKPRMEQIRGVIKSAVEKFSDQTFKKYKLDPKSAEKAAERGFEGTREQIKYLPAGTRFWDPKAGVTRTRKEDEFSKPVTGTQFNSAQQPLQQAATRTTDEEDLGEAAS